MTRPLKVGEYRKVKTWDELLATEGVTTSEYGSVVTGEDCPRFMNDEMMDSCGNVVKITRKNSAHKGWCFVEGFHYNFIAEFFTDDYYDENGNEVKMEEDMEKIKLSDIFKYIGKTSDRFINGDTYSLKRYDKGAPFSIQMIDLLGSKHTMRVSYFREIFEIVKLDQWHNDTNPLDQLETTTKQDIANSNKVLDRIALMREIEALQVQCEDMNKLIETKLNELGATHE